MPKRLSAWEPRLSQAVRDNASRPHEYGRWDCLLWPAAAVKAVTGKDFGRGHRGKYRSQASAYRYLGTLGFDSPAAMLDSLFPERPVGFAQRGHLALCDTPSGLVPGVIVGDTALVVSEIAATDGAVSGMARIVRARWLKAWDTTA